MTVRCGCTDQGDPTVFGQCRKCHPEPESIPQPAEHPWETTLDESERGGH